MSQPLWSEMDSEARRGACLKGRKAGLSASQIAKPLGCTRMAVIGMLKRMKDAGVPVPTSPYGPGSNQHKKSARTGLLIVRDKAALKPRSSVNAGAMTLALNAQHAEPPVTFIARENAFDPIPGTTPIGLMECGPRNCRFAVDGLKGPSKLFCGADKLPEESWCLAHRCIVYQPLDHRTRADRIATATVRKAA